jgi:excisionase family DNA binding protein
MSNGAGQLDFTEAVEYLGCTRNWLTTRVKNQEIKFFKLGRRYWFEADDLRGVRDTTSMHEALGIAPIRQRRQRRSA